jgi:hypothetical protein
MPIDSLARRESALYFRQSFGRGRAVTPDGTISNYDRRTLCGRPVFYTPTGSVTTVVDIGFASGIRDDPTAVAFSDVSVYVRDANSISIRRGRGRALGAFEAADCSLTLGNLDRRFEPNNASSPYGAEAIRPMRVLRVRVGYELTDGTLNAVRSCRFLGYITGWRPSYPSSGVDAIVDIQAVDYLSVLSSEDLSLDTASTVETATSADHFFALDETAGATAADAGSTPINGTYSAGVTLNDFAFHEIAPDRKAPHFDGAVGEVQFGTAAEWAQTGAVSVAAWVKLDGQVGGPDNGFADTIAEVANSSDFASGIAWSLAVNIDENVSVRHGNFRQAISGAADPNLNDGAKHHILATRSAGHIWRCYIDGVLTSTGPVDGSANAPGAGNQLTIGGEGHIGGSSQFWDGHIADLAIWNKELTAGEAASVYASQPLTRTTELTSDRVTAILDQIGIPVGLRSIDTGLSSMQGNTLAGSSADALNGAADVEASQLYINCEGQVVFEGRDYRSRLDVAGTFGDADGELKFDDLQLDYQIERVGNEITATRSAVTGEANPPVSQVAADATSQNAYGVRAKSFTADFADDAAAGDFARAILARRAEPDLVAQVMAVNPNNDPANLFPVVLAADISTRLQVNWRPDGGAPIAQDSFIESIDETITAKEYKVRWRLSPADRQVLWILGKSKLGLTTRLGW